MARGGEQQRSRRSPKDAIRKTKKKPCALCRDKVKWVDYKDFGMLRKYMSDRGKIRARRVTGNCTQHQRDIALAIKTARELVLLPYTQRTTTERSGGRARTRPDRMDRPPEVGASANGEGAAVPDVEEADEALTGADGELGDEASATLDELDAGELGVSGNGAGIEATDEADDGASSNGSGSHDATGDGA